MRAAVAAVAALALLAGCSTGSREADGTAPAPPATSSPPAVTPSATPTRPVVDAQAKRLRTAAAAALRDCPCGLFIRVRDKETDAKLEWYGVYDPKTRSAAVAPPGAGSQVRVSKGVTYFTGPESGDRWVRLDYSRLPDRIRRTTPLALTAGLDPALAFAMAGAVLYPTHDASSGKVRSYSVSFDVDRAVAAAGPSGPLLRRMLGDVAAYGAAGLRDGFHYVFFDLLGPGAADRHRVSVYVEVVRRHETRLSRVVAPPGAPVLTVR